MELVDCDSCICAQTSFRYGTSSDISFVDVEWARTWANEYSYLLNAHACLSVSIQWRVLFRIVKLSDSIRPPERHWDPNKSAYSIRTRITGCPSCPIESVTTLSPAGRVCESNPCTVPLGTYPGSISTCNEFRVLLPVAALPLLHSCA